MPVGREPVANHSHLAGISNSSTVSVDQDVPWMKARSPFRDHHCVTGRNQKRTAPQKLNFFIHKGLAMIVGALLFVPIAEQRFTDR